MDNIGNILSHIIQDLGIQEKLDGCRALTIWPQVVGEKVAAVTKPERFSRGRLFVRVENDSWRMELLFHRQEIIRKLNEQLPSESVEDIMLL